jgi:hypothetical protein
LIDDLSQPFDSVRGRRLYDAIRDAWATPHVTSTPAHPITDHDHWVEWFTSHGVPYEDVPFELLDRLLARLRHDMRVPPQVQGERSGESPQVSSLEGGSVQSLPQDMTGYISERQQQRNAKREYHARTKAKTSPDTKDGGTGLTG